MACRDGIRGLSLAAQGLLLVGMLGCAEPNPEPAATAVEPLVTASRFEADTAGTIRGRVLWQGGPPAVPDYEVFRDPLTGFLLPQKRTWPNPNAPVIDPRTRGVAGAVVFLRGVEADRARPWDHPPVEVEIRDSQYHVLQGGGDRRSGFVRRGDQIEIVSRDAVFHSARAGGAAFFTLALVEPGRVSRRALKEPGVVELSSGAGSYWMRAYLFVDDHPYYTHTDADGGFELRQVPPGSYRVVCWLPTWKKARHERDSEFGIVSRVFYQPPLEVLRQVTLGPRESQELSFTVSAADFPKVP